MMKKSKYTKPINIRISVEQYRKLKELAIPIAFHIRKMIDELIKRGKK